jgi:hypothetical protein
MLHFALRAALFRYFLDKMASTPGKARSLSILAHSEEALGKASASLPGWAEI